MLFLSGFELYSLWVPLDFILPVQRQTILLINESRFWGELVNKVHSKLNFVPLNNSYCGPTHVSFKAGEPCFIIVVQLLFIAIFLRLRKD